MVYKTRYQYRGMTPHSPWAPVAKLVDARDLKSLVLYERAGSSPAGRTNKKSTLLGGFFVGWLMTETAVFAHAAGHGPAQ